MHRSQSAVPTFEQGLVDETVGMEKVVGREAYADLDHLPESTLLRHGLPVHLPYPPGRAVSRDEDQGHLLIIRFASSRIEVGQGAAAGHDDGYRALCGKGYAEGKEARATLIGNAMAAEILNLQCTVYYAGITAAGAEYDVLDAVNSKQGKQLERERV